MPRPFLADRRRTPEYKDRVYYDCSDTGSKGSTPSSFDISPTPSEEDDDADYTERSCAESSSSSSASSAVYVLRKVGSLKKRKKGTPPATRRQTAKVRRCKMRASKLRRGSRASRRVEVRAATAEAAPAKSARDGRISRAVTIPVDTMCILRALCASEEEAGAVLGAARVAAVGGDDDDAASLDALLSPLSRRNEIAALLLLVSLLLRECCLAYAPPPTAGDAWEGGDTRGDKEGARAIADDAPTSGTAAQARPPPILFDLGSDGVPVLSPQSARHFSDVLVHRLRPCEGAEAEMTACAREGVAVAQALCALLAAASALEGTCARSVSEGASWVTGNDERDEQGDDVSTCVGGDSVAPDAANEHGAAPTPFPWGSDDDDALAAEEDATGTPPSATVASLAAAYRLLRVRGLLAHARNASALLSIAAGEAAAPPAQLAAPLPPFPPSPCLPSVGLEVQSAWCDLLLSRTKRIETREYELPQCLLGVPVALLSSPQGRGLVFSAAPPAPAAAAFVGTVIFTACKRYATRREWEADAPLHCVDVSAPADAFGWSESRPKFGWVVAHVDAAPSTPIHAVHLTPRSRLFRSLFILPHVAAAM